MTRGPPPFMSHAQLRENWPSGVSHNWTYVGGAAARYAPTLCQSVWNGRGNL